MPAKGNPTPPLVGGTSVRSTILEGYVFQSGIHKPEHSSILTLKYPQYFLTSLMDRIGAEEPTAQSVFSWNILERTRQSGSVTSLSGVPGTSATFTIPEFPYGSGNLGGLIVNDVIRVETGVLLRVTASTNNGGNQQVTVQKVDGSTITAAELANGMVFGHVFNAFAEGSNAPDGRLPLPVEDYNVTTILRRSFAITGSEFTNRTYIGDGSAWYWTIEEINRKEHARDREALILLGKLNDSGTKVSRGIIDYVTALGVITTYSANSGPSEADITEHIRKLRVEGGSAEYLVLCGSKFYRHVQLAFRDYFVGGGISFGNFGNNAVGLDVRRYDFMGIKVNFVYYELFDDKAMFPYSGSPSSTLIDFSDYSLWLDLGTDNTGNKLIKLRYKALDGYSRKFVQRLEVGMMNPASSEAEGGMVASGFDGFKVHLLSEIGIEVRLANRMGIMRAA